MNTQIAFMKYSDQVMQLWTRRQFLNRLTLAGSGCLVELPGISSFAGLSLTDPTRFPSLQRPLFEEVQSSASGIIWRHVNGRLPDYFLPETTGAGCAFFDYDNDGWMDIYLVNSGECDFYAPNPPLRNALYHNNRDGTFTDVTEKAGVPGGGYGMGAAVGDYDGDGWPDLYVTQYGRSILYHNNGDGTFTDVTEKAGSSPPAGRPVPCGSITTTMASWIYSSAASWTSTNRRTNSAETKRPESVSIAYLASTLLRRAGFFTTMVTVPSLT